MELDMDKSEEPMEELKGLRISTFDEEDERPDADNGMNYLADVDEDDDDEEDISVTLGFVEKPEHSWSLLPQLFPSKAGGVPAWLDPVDLPSARSCVCDICGEPLHFLLQVYAPISEKASTFHRTLYVFMCPSMQCLLRDQHEQWKRRPEKASRSVKIFRCQLPRANHFYSSSSPRCDGSDRPVVTEGTLCSWCGTWKGEKVCTRCRRAHYCSEKHQAQHWRTSHRDQCRQMVVSSEADTPNGFQSKNQLQKVASMTLWPEFEIINADESEFEREITEADKKAKELALKERLDESIKSLMDTFSSDDEKKSWAVFQDRVGLAPQQVLRYSRDTKARPLWPTSSGRPSKADIPKCTTCGQTRIFEFQILPQLLYYFGVNNEDPDSLDWATIAVYACSDSCNGSSPYKEEFAWVQLSSQSLNSA